MKRKLLLLTAFAVSALTGMRAQTDVTSTYLANASFEYSAEGTVSTAQALTNNGSYYGWNLPNLGTSFVNISVGDASSCNGQAFGVPTPKEGSFYYFCRRGWNSSNSADATLSTSSKTELQAGHYTITVDYKGLDSWDNEHTSKGSYLKIEAKSGDNVLVSAQTSAFEQVKGNTAGANKFKDDANWKSQTLTFDVIETSSVTFDFIHHFVGGVRTDMVLDNVKLTFEPFATADDYNALSGAITAAEAKTIGFDNGDYAPYNNTEALKKLVEAKAIDETGNNLQSTVQNLTTALNQATWTANENEVNAIFDGSFTTDYSGQTGNVQPIGWYRVKGTTGDGYNVRYVSGNTGLQATTSGKGLFTKMNAYYGWGEGYTMPLKANTYYTVSFIVGGWGDCEDKTGNVKIANPLEEKTQIGSFEVPNTNADSNKDSWVSFKKTFKTGDAGNYVLCLEPRNNKGKSQNQFVYGDFVIKRATAEELKELLKEEIDADGEASGYGDGLFLHSTSDAETYNSVYAAAQSVYNNVESSFDEIISAYESLKTAYQTYGTSSLNEPAESDVFNLQLLDGFEGNKVVTFKSGNASQGTYSVGYTHEAGSHYNQAVHFAKVSDTSNQYYIYINDDEGKKHYIGTGTNYGGNDTQIRMTDDASKALAVEVVLIEFNDGNAYNLKNTAANAMIGSNGDNGVYTADTYKVFNVVPATQYSYSDKIAAGKYGTRIYPVDTTLPEGVKAYSCETMNDATLELIEVTELKANTPYVIENTTDDEKEFEVYGYAVAKELSYTTGLLVGYYEPVNVAASTDAVSNYILQTQDGKQAFRKVTADYTTQTPNRAYLSVEGSSNVKAVFFPGQGDATGINAVSTLFGGDVEGIYTVGGAKVNSLQKGVNIIRTADGKTQKVLVK